MNLTTVHHRCFSIFASTLVFALRFAAVVVLAAGYALFARAEATKPRPAKPHAAAGARRASVVLITIDTLRADHVGCYGAGQPKTPTLESLGQDGVVFERAIAQVPLTWPSHAVILTGAYPFQNGVQDFTAVPLIVKPSARSGIRAGRRSEPVETAAVAPTLLELAGLKDSTGPIFGQFQSKALLGTRHEGVERQEAGPPVARDPTYSETFYPFGSFGWSPLHGMESEKFHFIEAPKPELYDLQSDPMETHNIAGEQPATVAVLREKLQALLARNPFRGQDATAGNLSPDAQEKLRALGYFGFRAAVSPDALEHGLADPKDKLWEFNAILKAADAYRVRDPEAAEALLAKVQEQDPKIYVVPFMLGESALQRNDWQGAAEQLQRCLELNPTFDNAMTGLALALGKLGRAEEAETWLDKAIAGNAQNYRAWYQKGLMAAETSAATAEAAYAKAVTIQPNFAPGQRALGMSFFQQKNYVQAAVHLEKAIALGVKDARIHNYLGICYAQTKQLPKAIHEHQRAIELDPKSVEAHLNLGFDYEKLGKNQAAKVEYEQVCRLNVQMCQLIRSRQK